MADSGAEIKALVQQAFDVSKEGKINVQRVLNLTRLDFDHPKWKQAIKAVQESLHSQSSREYVRFYMRDEKTGEYEKISLDFSKV